MLKYSKYKDNHTYYYTITDTKALNEDQITFQGKAKCLEQDYDFENDYTGYHIAEERAKIKYYKYLLKKSRANERYIKYVYNASPSKGKNGEIINSYLDKIYSDQRLEVSAFNLLIQYTETELKKYLEGKEDMYQKLRKVRRKPKGES